MSILLDERSRVLIQGITGQQARTHVKYMAKYGTRVVASKNFLLSGLESYACERPVAARGGR